MPYLHTALVPSGLHLSLSFTEKWGDLGMTYVPKRGLPTILQPPFALSPFHVSGCPQLFSLGWSPLGEDVANHLLPNPVSNLIFSCSQRGGFCKNINCRQSWSIRSVCLKGWRPSRQTHPLTWAYQEGALHLGGDTM